MVVSITVWAGVLVLATADATEVCPMNYPLLESVHAWLDAVHRVVFFTGGAFWQGDIFLPRTAIDLEDHKLTFSSVS